MKWKSNFYIYIKKKKNRKCINTIEMLTARITFKRSNLQIILNHYTYISRYTIIILYIIV